MKKILIVSGSIPPIKCGVGYYTHRLVSESEGKLNLSLLSTKGVSSDLIVPLKTTDDWRIRRLPKILSLIKQTAPEVVHIQYPAIGYGRQLGINLLPYLLRIKHPRLKLIVTLHEYHESRLIGKIRDLITVAPVHRIIVSNHADKAALPIILRRKTSVIPIGSNFAKAPRNRKNFLKLVKKVGLDPSKEILMFFGFTYPNKRLEILLDALALPAAQDYQCLLLTALDPHSPYQSMLLKKIEKINQPHIRLGVAGFLPDNQVSEVLQEGRYFILPQSKPINAKSSTAITAVTHGLVLVSAGSDVSAETKPFRHMINCYLAVPLTSSAIIEALISLQKGDNLERISEGALSLESYFSWAAIVKGHIKIYETV